MDLRKDVNRIKVAQNLGICIRGFKPYYITRVNVSFFHQGISYSN